MNVSLSSSISENILHMQKLIVRISACVCHCQNRAAGHLPPWTFAPCLKTACEDICPLICPPQGMYKGGHLPPLKKTKGGHLHLPPPPTSPLLKNPHWSTIRSYTFTHFDINEPHCGICSYSYRNSVIIFSSPEPWLTR